MSAALLWIGAADSAAVIASTAVGSWSLDSRQLHCHCNFLIFCLSLFCIVYNLMV